jgi:ATP-dependent DNA helicase RecQ
LYAKKDRGLQSFFIRESTAPAEIKSARWKSLDAIIQYAEGGECRQSGILTYFRDRDRIQSCGHCDVCDPGSSRRVPHAFVAPSKAVFSKGRSKEKKYPTEKIAAPLTAQESERMKAIREWRLEYARAEDMPAFIIFSNRTLEDIVRKSPETLADLERVYGLGPQKIEAFGKELLEILRKTV